MFAVAYEYASTRHAPSSPWEVRIVSAARNRRYGRTYRRRPPIRPWTRIVERTESNEIRVSGVRYKVTSLVRYFSENRARNAFLEETVERRFILPAVCGSASRNAYVVSGSYSHARVYRHSRDRGSVSDPSERSVTWTRRRSTRVHVYLLLI